ncbi:conserved hypothetical protein [Ricinus communis]|uniref:Uncharacterized protein n=1 Tax=Ricinus communis TaxID=3988 RepID=B9SA83_RICCO|nr:conserved hypothetical protein [Ricinus communis]
MEGVGHKKETMSPKVSFREKLLDLSLGSGNDEDDFISDDEDDLFLIIDKKIRKPIEMNTNTCEVSRVKFTWHLRGKGSLYNRCQNDVIEGMNKSRFVVLKVGNVAATYMHKEMNQAYVSNFEKQTLVAHGLGQKGTIYEKNAYLTLLENLIKQLLLLKTLWYMVRKSEQAFSYSLNPLNVEEFLSSGDDSTLEEEGLLKDVDDGILAGVDMIIE